MGGDLLLVVNSQRHLLIPGWLWPVKGPVLAGLLAGYSSCPLFPHSNDGKERAVLCVIM